MKTRNVKYSTEISAQGNFVFVIRVELGKAISFTELAAQYCKRKDQNKIFLTPYEKEILNLVLQGIAPKEMAVVRGCTLRAIKAHLNHLYTKFDVRGGGRATLTAMFMKQVQKVEDDNKASSEN